MRRGSSLTLGKEANATLDQNILWLDRDRHYFLCLSSAFLPSYASRSREAQSNALSYADKASIFLHVAIILVGLPVSVLFSPFLLLGFAWHRAKK